MGTTCSLKWREAAECERLRVAEPGRPIADGLGEYVEIAEAEMCGERFDVPALDALVFASRFESGEVHGYGPEEWETGGRRSRRRRPRPTRRGTLARSNRSVDGLRASTRSGRRPCSNAGGVRTEEPMKSEHEVAGTMGDPNLSGDDEGKRVVDASGETVGILADVRRGTGYVDPDPGIEDKVLARLGWENAADEEYPIDAFSIATVTDEEIRLKGES